MDGLYHRHLHSRSRLDTPAGTVLVEYHQSGWHTSPGLHFAKGFFRDEPMTTVQTPLIRDRLAQVVREAVARTQSTGFLPDVALPEVTIERPSKPEQGDFATNFALRAKRAVGPRGPAPFDIASAIVAQIAQDPPPYLAGVEPAQPGFVNFTLADDWLRQQIDTIVADGSAYGSVPLGNQGR